MVSKVRLDHKSVCWKSSGNKFLFRKLRQGNEAGNRCPPSIQCAVNGQHQGDARRGSAGIPVTTVVNALQQVLGYALVTDDAVTKKVPRRAEQPEIVQCLDNGNISSRTSRIDH